MYNTKESKFNKIYESFMNENKKTYITKKEFLDNVKKANKLKVYDKAGWDEIYEHLTWNDKDISDIDLISKSFDKMDDIEDYKSSYSDISDDFEKDDIDTDAAIVVPNSNIILDIKTRYYSKIKE